MANFDISLSFTLGDFVNLVTLSYFIYSRRNKGLTPKEYHRLLSEIIDLKRGVEGNSSDALQKRQ